MKHCILTPLFICSALGLFAQGVGIGTINPSPSAMLEVHSDTSGVLLPRMTDVQRDAITNPSTGLLVFVTTDSTFYYFDGSAWVTLIERTAEIKDNDADTRVTVEATPDDDMIRIYSGGTEYFRMDSGRLEVLNNGDNIFIGDNVGMMNTSGYENTAVGTGALRNNITGHSNTALGFQADIDLMLNDLVNATAIGARAYVTASNSLVLGSISGLNGAIADVKVGIGTTAPMRQLDVRSAEWIAGTFGPKTAGDRVVMGNLNGTASIGGHTNNLNGWADLAINPGGGKVGIGTTSPDTTLHVVGNIKIEDGNEGNGKVLVSDANGVASWAVDSVIADTDNDTRISVEATPDDDLIRFYSGGTEYIRMDGGRLEVLNYGDNVFIGRNVGTYMGGAGTQNVATGYNALALNLTGNWNVATGAFALNINQFGYSNVATGNGALSNNTGNENVATGSGALSSNDSGNRNTALGFAADVESGNLANATAIGALAEVAASNSLVLGSINGVNGATADVKVGIGTTAPIRLLDVRSADSIAGTFGPKTSGNRVVLGNVNGTASIGGHTDALTGWANLAINPGGGNVGIGTSAPLRRLDVRSVDQTAFNWIAGTFGSVPDGDRVVIGNLTGTASIGAHANALNAWADLAINPGGGNVGIGNSAPTHPLHMGSGARCTAGGVWTDASDRSRKYDIADISYGLEAIMAMRPVSYKYKVDDSRSIGFIAQEMELVLPEVVNGEEGDKGIAYGLLTSVIVKGMQELISENMRLRDQLDAQRKTQEATQSELAEMRSEIESIKRALVLQDQ